MTVGLIQKGQDISPVIPKPAPAIDSSVGLRPGSIPEPLSRSYVEYERQRSGGGLVSRHYRFIIAFSALRLAQNVSGSGLDPSLLQATQQQLAAQRDALERQVAAQAERQRRAQVEAERREPPFSGAREALEEPERRVTAAPAEQLRQAEERGNEERREEAESERKREAHLREEEWRAALEARQAPLSGAEQSREEQHTSPASEAPPAITPTGSPNATLPMFARFPLLRLGLAFFVGAAVFIFGWMLRPSAIRRGLEPDDDGS